MSEVQVESPHSQTQERTQPPNRESSDSNTLHALPLLDPDALAAVPGEHSLLHPTQLEAIIDAAPACGGTLVNLPSGIF
eukprot:3758462-Amphidinium_carterae.1